MLFSEQEIVAILKKNLPKTDYKDLANVASSIVSKAEHWQEVDLDEHVRDELETKVLHDICKRKSDGETPKDIRLFFRK